MDKYTVERNRGCIIVSGSMPLTEMITLMHEIDDAVMDTQLIMGLGVMMVLGLPEDLDVLRNDPDIKTRIEKRADDLIGDHVISDDARRWLISGQRSQSSNAMFQHLTGIRGLDLLMTHPHDPADFGRCRLLLEQVPELAGRLIEMSSVSPQWNALVPQWALLSATMDSESPLWRDKQGSAPETYKLLTTILSAFD